jgi:uncharacterized membrane protein
MLIVFPIGLWVFSFVCDIIYHAGSRNPMWKLIAFYTIAGGIIGALLAAIPGFIDYLSITDRRVKRIATAHMALNLVVVALFIFNLGFRYNASPEREIVGVVLSLIAISLMAVSGWLGGTMVYEYHMGVSPQREEREIRRAA